MPTFCSLIPPKQLACGRQHLTYGGEVVRALTNPDLEKLSYGPEVPRGHRGYSMLKMGEWMRDAFKLNHDQRNLRIFSPDETYSNQLQAVFEETDRAWQWPIELGWRHVPRRTRDWAPFWKLALWYVARLHGNRPPRHVSHTNHSLWGRSHRWLTNTVNTSITKPRCHFVSHRPV